MSDTEVYFADDLAFTLTMEFEGGGTCLGAVLYFFKACVFLNIHPCIGSLRNFKKCFAAELSADSTFSTYVNEQLAHVEMWPAAWKCEGVRICAVTCPI